MEMLNLMYKAGFEPEGEWSMQQKSYFGSGSAQINFSLKVDDDPKISGMRTHIG